MRTLTFLAALGLSILLHAQTEVMQSSLPFSDGSHPTMVVAFDNAESGAVESWYKAQLKEFSNDVSHKKEVRALGARVPEVSQDTITVLCKAEQGKKSTRVQLHLAYRIHGQWIGNTSDPKLMDGAKKHAYMLGVRYKKHLLETALLAEQKTLEHLQGELANMVKEKGRAESGIEKNRSKGVEAQQEKVQAEADLKTNESAVTAKHAAMGTSPTEEEAKQFQDLVKNGTKLQEKIAKETKNSEEADQKVKELEEQVKDNIASQETKQRAIDEQTGKVAEAKKALENVN
ncbi:MAG: hypothetical protein ABI599_03985 [Flavobacteriales bacterium]